MEDKKQIYEVLEERAFKELEQYEQMMLQKEPCEIYDACHDIVFFKEMLGYVQDQLSSDFEECEIECLRNESPLLQALYDIWMSRTDLSAHTYEAVREIFEELITECEEE